MKPTITIEMREFNAALAARVQSTKKTLPQVVNQAAFNVAARAMRGTKPSAMGLAPAKWAVQRYMGLAGGRPQGGRTGGTSKGKSAARSLRSVTLIAQAAFFKKHGYGIGKGKSNRRTKRIRQNTSQQASAFGRNGKRKANDYGSSLSAKPKAVMGSDYGDAMKRYAGKVFNKAVRSVGYLSAVWVPVLRALAPLAKFKGYAKGLTYGVRWKTSSAAGAVVPAQAGTGNVGATLDVSALAPRMTGGAEAVVRAALQQAIDAEAAEMKRHLADKLAQA